MLSVIVLHLFYVFDDFCYLRNKGLLDAESGQVVLAGDPKQLGPILRSPFALRYDMGKHRRTHIYTVLFITL